MLPRYSKSPCAFIQPKIQKVLVKIPKKPFRCICAANCDDCPKKNIALRVLRGKRVLLLRFQKHILSFGPLLYIYIYINNFYESQPKAWAEYRYKRSEANLGGVGGEGSESGRFGKVRPEPAGGELKKRPAALPFFGARTRSSILDTCWWFLTVFIWFQTPKHCNLQCFCAFGMAKVRLATC